MKEANIYIVVAGKEQNRYLTTGQKFDNLPPDNKIAEFVIGHKPTQDIESTTEDALRRIAVFLQFQFFDIRLPKPDDKGPGEDSLFARWPVQL